MDLEIIAQNCENFMKAFPSEKLYYAVKANPSPDLLSLLVQKGASFDTASIPEIEMVLKAGAKASKISFGNTIKKSKDIEKAYQLGVRLFVVDSKEEVQKIAKYAKNSDVFCRILSKCEGAQWPLSKKFGCHIEEAIEVLEYAHQEGLNAIGVSFHVGSQQINLNAWDTALKDSAYVFSELEKKGIILSLLNLGGGFSAPYLEKIPSLDLYAQAIKKSIKKYFGDKNLRIIYEPGRGLVAEAGILCTEIVLISKKRKSDDIRWVYIDAGKFNGLIETLNESIRYKIVSHKDKSPLSNCILAGPTCDSVDVLYERDPYPLPENLEIGDKLFILGAGAYTSSYASVAFNGFPPLKTYIMPLKKN